MGEAGPTRSCGTCGTQLRPLFSSMYCPNDRCGLPPASSDWRAILPKLPDYARTAVEKNAPGWGGVTWYAYDAYALWTTLWFVSLQMSRQELLSANVAFRVNPDGTVTVVKNRYGPNVVASVPDA